MPLAENKVHQGDCLALLKKLSDGSVDLAFADPPFNINYEYDVYKDKKPYLEYLDWTRKWMSQVSRVLKPNGTFWVAIGDEYAAEFKLILQNELNLTCRSWVIWYYTFGVNCKSKFTRSHAHLFHFVKNPKNYTFNAFDPDLRIPSARQLVYADIRANPLGRLPDDTWILRPQDVPDGFSPDSDTWYFSRVAGTFKERRGFHGCQMPEQLLGRIIRASSNLGDETKPPDLVLDPFAGSATTLAVAKKLGRRFIGCELSAEYVTQGNARLKGTSVGEPLSGPENSVTSAKPTPRRTKKSPDTPSVSTEIIRRVPVPKHALMSTLKRERKKQYTEIELEVINAFLVSHAGFSADRVILADPELNAAFLDACKSAGVPGNPVDWNRMILRMRKASKLPQPSGPRRISIRRERMDDFSFASEIAWECIREQNAGLSLDEILSDPVIAQEFDRTANRFAPGFTPFQYRWAALSIRKYAKKIQKEADELFGGRRLPRLTHTDATKLSDVFNGQVGAYVLQSESGNALYAGESQDLGNRIRRHRENGILTFDRIAIRIPIGQSVSEKFKGLALKFALIDKFQPKWNVSRLGRSRS